MPLYEYVCTVPECLEKDKIKEVLQGVHDGAPACEICTVPLVRTYTTTAQGIVIGSSNPCIKGKN